MAVILRQNRAVPLGYGALESPEAAAEPFGVTFIGLTQDDSDDTTHTYSGVDIGTAESTREVFIAVHWGLAGYANLTSATIGGVGATLHQNVMHQSANRGCAIISAAVPSGATATIVLNWDAGVLRSRIGVYRVIDRTSGVTGDNQNNVIATAVPRTIDIAVADDGAVIGAVSYDGDQTQTWTGANENYDTNAGEQPAMRIGSAHETGLSASTRTVGFTPSGNIQQVALVVVTFA